VKSWADSTSDTTRRLAADITSVPASSNLPASTGQFHAGPAFTLDRGTLTTRYSLTVTDRYMPDAADEPATVQRALTVLARAAQPGSPHLLRFTLTARQGLVFANDTLAHGREACTEDPAAPRVMLRALFTSRPAAGETR
jgi:hypothetical protein